MFLAIFSRLECSRHLAGLGEDLLLKEGIEVEGDTLPVEEGPRTVMNYIGIPYLPYISTYSS